MKNSFLSRWSQRKLDADKDITSTPTHLKQQNDDDQILADKQLVRDDSERNGSERNSFENDRSIDANTAPAHLQDDNDPKPSQAMVENTDALDTEIKMLVRQVMNLKGRSRTYRLSHLPCRN